MQIFARLILGVISLVLIGLFFSMILTPAFTLNVCVAPGHPYAWLALYTAMCIPVGLLANLFGNVGWALGHECITGKNE